MKTLFVMRHAKSSWGEPGLDDFDRPLLEKGKKRTKNIIDFLLKKKVTLDMILTSPAVRAIETARIMAHALNLPSESIKEEKKIYTADAAQLEDLFYDLPKSVDNLLLIGHNPTMTSFANNFLEQKIDFMPTSAIVGLEFNIDDWSEIGVHKPELKFIIFPKMLGTSDG
jgi:phosphohistidine phosphatase